MTSGKMLFEESVVDMSDLVKQTVNSLPPAFREKQVQIELNVCDGIPSMRGDRDRLRQVITNLLSNALKFTHVGGHVHVEVNKTPADVQVVVQDDGEGIPQNFLPFVFDEFRQAETSRKKAGLGLGLSIARRIVEFHQGSVRAALSVFLRCDR